jgi:hypothetical protein
MTTPRIRRWFALLATTTTAAVTAGDGPPLEGPTGSVATRPAPRPAGPVVGSTVPRLLPPRSVPREAGRTASSGPATPTLEGPSPRTAPTLPPAFEEPPSFRRFPTPIEAPRVAEIPPLEGPGTLHLETVPDEDLDPRLHPLDPLPPATNPAPRLTRDEMPPLEAPSPPRRSGGLSNFARPRTSSPDVNPTPRRRSGLDEPSDPAADAALRRRVEEQVRIAAGRHLRSLEVRVKDQRVAVRLHVDHFWNRKAIRRSVESLPALSGVRYSVDVD